MGKQAKRDSFNILMWWNDYHLLLLTTLIVTYFLGVSCILADNEVGQVGKVMGNIWEFEDGEEPGFCIASQCNFTVFFFNLPRPLCFKWYFNSLLCDRDDNANNSISCNIIKSIFIFYIYKHLILYFGGLCFEGHWPLIMMAWLQPVSWKSPLSWVI